LFSCFVWLTTPLKRFASFFSDSILALRSAASKPNRSAYLSNFSKRFFHYSQYRQASVSASTTSNTRTHGFAFPDKMDQALVDPRDLLLKLVSSLNIVHYADCYLNQPGTLLNCIVTAGCSHKLDSS
jgi:hypothetical protein